jgi:transcriptional regulator of acetoin/glycerol metabolism
VEHLLYLAEKRGQKTARFAPAALALIRQYPWPGNVRELQNAIHYALARCDGAVVGPSDLPPELRQGLRQRHPAGKLDPETVQAALTACGGNKVKAARLLGVGRATLYRFLASHETSVSHR